MNISTPFPDGIGGLARGRFELWKAHRQAKQVSGGLDIVILAVRAAAAQYRRYTKRAGVVGTGNWYFRSLLVHTLLGDIPIEPTLPLLPVS